MHRNSMMKDEKILVIDDEQVILNAVSRIATAEGLNVDSDNDASSALKKLSQKDIADSLRYNDASNGWIYIFGRDAEKKNSYTSYYDYRIFNC